VAGNIIAAWILTFPSAGAIAAVAYLISRPLFA
jgi:PiT family inorganic phosphate transporter